MDYQFKSLGRTCAATGNDLVPGTLCHSVVVERDDETIRLDFSEEGWTGPPEGPIGHWRCLVPEPAETKPRVIDPEELMRYFEQLSENGNPVQEKFRYVIALLLLQKRRLRLDGSRQDGEIEYLQLVGSHGEGPFEVRDQELEPNEVEILQRDLNAQLAAQWEPSQ